MSIKLRNDVMVESGRIIPDVIDVEYLGDKRLYIEFNDGAYGEVDLSEYINAIPALHDLKDEKQFARFYLSNGTIGWRENRDISPRWLHSHLTPAKLH